MLLLPPNLCDLVATSLLSSLTLVSPFFSTLKAQSSSYSVIDGISGLPESAIGDTSRKIASEDEESNCNEYTMLEDMQTPSR